MLPRNTKRTLQRVGAGGVAIVIALTIAAAVLPEPACFIALFVLLGPVLSLLKLAGFVCLVVVGAIYMDGIVELFELATSYERKR